MNKRVATIELESFDFDSPVVVAEPVRTIQPIETDVRPVHGPIEFSELSFEEKQIFAPSFRNVHFDEMHARLLAGHASLEQ